MKIKKDKLLRLINTELKNLRERETSTRAADVTRAEKARQDYVDNLSGAWREFINNAQQAIQRREPITRDLVPQELHVWSRTRGSGAVELRVYDEPRATHTSRVENSPSYRKLDALRRLLETVEDDIISTYGLEKAGFRLETILRQAAEE